jgi:hypothetical protein
MEDQDRKKVILTLRWTAIIVTSYLILFGKGRVTDLHLSHYRISLIKYFSYFRSKEMVFKYKIILSISHL